MTHHHPKKGGIHVLVPSFVIIDHPGSGGASEPLSKYAAAIQKGIEGDFAPEYQRTLTMRYDTAVASTDEIIVGLFEHPDQPGALGYHDVAPNGSPYIKVFPKLDAQDGAKLSVTLDHEAKEALEDLFCDLARQGDDGNFWADEPCDAVEQDEYMVDDVSLSNFVLPGWYSGRSKYDFLGKLKKPLSLTPGGYAQWIGVSGQWTQITHEAHAPRSYRQAEFGRSHRRRHRK